MADWPTMSDQPSTILGLPGSLRRGSLNATLLRAAAALAPASVRLVQGTLQGIPLYDGDLEAESGLPAPVRELKEQVASAAGLLLVTPEYNSSIPGVFKNAIDWASRPASDIARVFGNRPVAVMGASPGRFGTVQAQDAWLPVLRSLGMRAWSGRLTVAGAGKVFDEEGRVVDERVRTQLQEFMAGFAAFVVDNARR